MGFEENKGQLADENGNPLPNVLFKSRGTGPGIYITTSGLTYVFVKQNVVIARNKEDETHAAYGVSIDASHNIFQIGRAHV